MVRINSRKRSEQIKNDDNETLSPEPDTKRIKEDETHATTAKSASRKRSINAAGKPAEVGIIHKVVVENFMCHRKLSIQLNRNVNFIFGQNGSGKSAILAAIQICLGAGARRTHRARNLKELVRKESVSACNNAIVRVTLLNRGNDAYQHDVYGDYITVERTISLGGGFNGYKLLDEEGKEKSRLKKDLDAMLDQLNIQVENPVAVLDQEEAKKFLCGKPEEKYAFFLKATELERIDRSYAATVDNIQELDETNVRVKHAMAPAMENVQKLEREWKEFQEMEKLEDKLSDLRVNYAWSVYKDFTEKVEVEQMHLKKIELKLNKRQQELVQADSIANADGTKEKELQESLNELSAEAKLAAKKKSEQEEEYRTVYGPVKTHERTLMSLKREIGVAKRKLKSAAKHLQDIRDDIKRKAGSAESEEAKRTERMEKAEQDLATTKENHHHIATGIASSLKKYEELEPREDSAVAATAAARRQLGGISKKVQELKASEGSNSLAVFGSKCVAMDQKVERARQQRQFRGLVVGPIGKFIKIANGKEHLASIAELAFGGGTLDRFIVTNDADRATLMGLRRSVGCNSFECGVFQIHDGPRYQVRPPPSDMVETIATVLNITNDLVFNCLVDNSKIDQVALMTSKGEDELLMDDNGKKSIRGGNIKQVYFLPDGDFWQVSQSGYLSMVSNERRLKQTIGIDKTEAIREAEKDANQIRNELDDLRAKEADLKHERKQYKIKWNEHNSSMQKSQALISKLEGTIEEIQSETADAAEFDTPDTIDLEDDVKEAQQTYEDVKHKETDTKVKIEDLKPSVDMAKEMLEETTSRNDKILSDIDKAEKMLEEYMHGQTERKRNVEKKRAKVQQAEEIRGKQLEMIENRVESSSEAKQKAKLVTYSCQKAKAERERKSQMLENDCDFEIVAEAEHVSQEEYNIKLEEIEPVDTRKESTFYKTKIQRVEKSITREKEKRQLSEKDPEVALEKYQRAKKDLDSKKIQVETIENNVISLVEDVKSRKQRWRKFRSHITTLTNEAFDEMLNKKGSSGTINFDHDEGQLNLTVQKDNRDESSQTNDVKALSGGERSFTTLSLLLALGESLETPFRVMDEFDVFLDPVSRRIALKTMITVAKEMEHRQFIFITPQDLTNLQTDDMLKIFHLKPPARSELVGGPSQQTLEFDS